MAMTDLAGKTVLVTGAGGSIGGSLTRAFAAKGARLVLTDLIPETLEAARQSVPDTDVLAQTADLTKEDDVAALAEAARSRFGTVDVLVNNAAVSTYAPTWELPLEHLDWMLKVNLFGTAHVLRHFVPAMIAAGTPGHIVNFASMAGLIAFNDMGGYCASKHAVVGLTECLKFDLKGVGAPIGVTLVAPGPVKTQGMEFMRAKVRELDDKDLAQRMLDKLDELDAMVQQGAEPDDVAGMVIDAMAKDIFWLPCPPEVGQGAIARAKALAADMEAASKR